MSALEKASVVDKERIFELEGILKAREDQIIAQRERIERLVFDIDGMATVYRQSELCRRDDVFYPNQLNEMQIRGLEEKLKKAQEATAREIGRRTEAKYEAEDWKKDAVDWEARAEEFEEKFKKSKTTIARLETEVNEWMTKARNWEAAFESLAEKAGSLKAARYIPEDLDAGLISLYHGHPEHEPESMVDKLARSTTPTLSQE